MAAKKRNAYLVGYWHDVRYFKSCTDLIRKDFAMRGEHQSEFAELLNASESVCLNVRRTDFVEISAERDYRTECDKDYYERAIEVILAKHKDIHIFGFSDDIDWCETNLKLQKQITWVPHSEAGVKFGRYFWLMRQCKHFIIPNSTFAWWAAWLGENPDKTVVCPKHWYHNPEHQSEGLLPEDWHLL